MGYFPNGDSGLSYELKHCDKCWHQDGDGDGETSGCMVWLVHLLCNYDDRDVLDNFIPRQSVKEGGDGTGNGPCKMFVDKSRVAPLPTPEKKPEVLAPCEGQGELFPERPSP